MSYVSSEAQCLVHAVALNRLHSRRADHTGASPAPSSPSDFADTVPLWFRSEAFAEDVDDASGAVAADTRASAGRRQRIDVQVIAAGAAILRLTLQALQSQRRG